MKFHFRQDSGSGGVLLHETNQSRMATHFMDAKWSSPTSVKARKALKDECPSNPASDDDDDTHMKGISPIIKSKRALHLEHHESECFHANPDPHSRPRSRQFFRLGRHRHRAASPPRMDENCQVTKPRGIASLRKPTMRRTMSLPNDLKTIKAVASAEESSLDSKQATSSEVTEAHDDDKAPEPPKRLHRRHVTFTSVQVREYSRILGDHPCCPSGPPLSLGWELERQDTFQFEVYEKEREPTRRSKSEIRLGCEDRREILSSLVMPVTMEKEDGNHSSQDASPSSCENSSDDATTCCALYSRADIRRAERKLEKERAGNHRAHRKMNKCFFKPLTPAECSLAPMSMEDTKSSSSTCEDPSDSESINEDEGMESC